MVKMKCCSLLIAALLGSCSGCGLFQPQVSTGYRFEIIRPPAISANALVTQTSGMTGVAGVGTAAGESASPQFATGSAAAMHYSCGSAAVGAGAGAGVGSAALSCTLQNVCDSLEALQARLNRMEARIATLPPGQPAERLNMPKGQTNP